MNQLVRVVACMCLFAGAGASARAQDPAAIEAGARIYDENCSSCHGENLRNPTAGADLRALGANDRPRFDNAIREGRGQMPSWVGVLSAEELDQVWAFIRSRAR